jgi:hypothetical protein
MLQPATAYPLVFGAFWASLLIVSIVVITHFIVRHLPDLGARIGAARAMPRALAQHLMPPIAEDACMPMSGACAAAERNLRRIGIHPLLE